jgi:hypothetical protein
MMFRFSFLLPSLCSLCLCGSISASPRDELLRLVPDDAGFCVVVRDLRDQLGRLARSPFAAQVAASPFGQSFAGSPELKKLAEFDRQLQAALNLSWAQLRDDVLGDAVVLAYTPGPPGKPEQERGLLLVHARRPDLLAGLFDRLNEVQKKSGEISAVEPRSHEGQTYYRRQKAKDGDEYYYVRGPLLLLSDKEEALKRALERDRRAPPVAAEAPALARRLDSLGVGRSLAVWWVNPKAFAPALRQKLGATAGGEAAFLATFARYWDALDGVAVSLSVERELTVGITTAVRPEALPAAARRLLAEPARPSAVWGSFPANALFVAAGRLSLPPLADVGGEFLTGECRGEIRDALAKTVGAVLGRDVLPELLRRLGPDWGVCVAPPAPGDKAWLPSLTAVLRLRAEGAVPVEQRVLDGLDFAARCVAVAYNSHRPDQMRLRTVQQEGVEVRFLAADQGFPPGLQPAFAWKDGFLVFASSPEAVRRFRAPKGEPPPAAEVPLVRVALQGWAGYLRAYREPLAAFLADAHGQSLGDIHAKLDGLMASLEPFDVLELTQRTGPGQATLTLRLRTMARLQPE